MVKSKSTLLSAFIISGLVLFLSGCGGPNLFDHLFNFGAQGPCMIVVIILDIIFLFELFQSTKSTGDKLLWALLIIFLPLLGCLLYYFLGRSKAPGR